MKNLDKLAQIKEQIAKLRGQVPAVAQTVRDVKASLPKITDPVVKARQALDSALAAAGDTAAQDFAGLQNELKDLQAGFPDVGNAVSSAMGILSAGEQGLQEALKASSGDTQQKLLGQL